MLYDPGFKIQLLMLSFLLIGGCVLKPDFDAVTLSKIDGIKGEANLLRNNQWYLQAYSYEGDWISNFETERINIVFNNEISLHGFSGCNVFSAKYKIIANHLSISSLANTKKVCQSPGNIIMKTESHFLELLKRELIYNVDFNTLILSNLSGKRVLVFKKMAESL